MSPVLNESIESAARRTAGGLFQHLGPAAKKARSPNRVFIRLQEDRIYPSIEVVDPQRTNATPYNYSRAYTQGRPHDATCRPASRSQIRSEEDSRTRKYARSH